MQSQQEHNFSVFVVDTICCRRTTTMTIGRRKMKGKISRTFSFLLIAAIWWMLTHKKKRWLRLELRNFVEYVWVEDWAKQSRIKDMCVYYSGLVLIVFPLRALRHISERSSHQEIILKTIKWLGKPSHEFVFLTSHTFLHAMIISSKN